MGSAADPGPLRPAELTVAELLERLASRTSVPAGGAAAALHAAQAAALVAMAARFSIRGRDPETDALATEVVEAAERLRRRALTAAEDDVAAFSTVKAAWSLPEGEEREERITAALVEAAAPPLAVLDLAREVVALAERLLPVVPASVAADLAAAADAAHAAASTSRRNVRTNLARVDGHPLLDQVADVDELLRRAIDIGRTAG
jgi:formiminotetrahydrofolate cyclodeaminase